MLTRYALGIVALTVAVVSVISVSAPFSSDAPGVPGHGNVLAGSQGLAADGIGGNLPPAADLVVPRWQVPATVRTVSTRDTVIIPGTRSVTGNPLLVSAHASRIKPVKLHGAGLLGPVYIFASGTGVDKVEFWLDDESRSGEPIQIESHDPFDFAGGTARVANAFDTRDLSSGRHTITLAFTDEVGIRKISTAEFSVLPPDFFDDTSLASADSQGATSTTAAIVPSSTAAKAPTTSKPTTSTTSKPDSSTTAPQPSGDFDAVVSPGTSIQAVVDGLPQGARILIKSGVHKQQQIKPKSGMTFVGESGAVLDGMNSTSYAFVAWSGEATNVTVDGLEIRGYVQAEDAHGAVYVAHTTNWVVKNCEIHHNAYSGINVGSNSVVKNCKIHANGRIGLKANGNGFVIENNEIWNNNPSWKADPLWEAGGIKFIKATGGLIRNNYVHHNNGPGIWADVDANGTVIEKNVVEYNTHTGIDYEISSGGVIRNNTVRYNGLDHPGGWLWGAGITIRGPGIRVTGNVVQGNANGIALIQTDRGSKYDVRDIVVENNVIINSGQNGGARSGGGAAIFDTSRFEGNEYRYSEYSSNWWRWDDTTMTKDEWVGAGNDGNGVFKIS